jgi:hypothetical protein
VDASAPHRSVHCLARHASADVDLVCSYPLAFGWIGLQQSCGRSGTAESPAVNSIRTSTPRWRCTSSSGRRCTGRRPGTGVDAGRRRRRRGHSYAGAGQLISESGADPSPPLRRPGTGLPSLTRESGPTASAKGPTAAFHLWHDGDDLLVAWIITVIAQHCRRDPLTSSSCTGGYTSRC